MASDGHFQITAEGRKEIIEDIANLLSPEIRISAERKITELVNDWEGWDGDAMAILQYSAERGRFQEFFDRLVEQHKNGLSYLPKSYRRAEVPEVARTYSFVMGCYKELGIKPQK